MGLTPPKTGSDLALYPHTARRLNDFIPMNSKGEAENDACPTDAEPASRLAGACCPITLGAMLLLCSPANFLRWVRRIFTV